MPQRELTEWELGKELVSVFGISRASQLVGWAVLWGLIGKDGDLKAFRLELQEKGLCRSAAYEALSDYRRFREHIVALENSSLTDLDVVERVGRLAARSVAA